MQFSLMTLGDAIADPITGALMNAAERYRMIVDAAVIADRAGLYGINLGEHHGLGYYISAPPVLLAAIAACTERLRLGTAVTLAANLDPYRVAEDYSTVDVISSGRVEIVAGRGNFYEKTYHLFGHRLDESAARFRESMELLCTVWPGDPITWRGKVRPPVNGEALQPKPVQANKRPFWIGGGKSRDTAELAAELGLGLMLPSAFGEPESFRPVVDHYRDAFVRAGHAHAPAIGGCWHMWIDRDGQRARQRFEPRYRAYHQFTQATMKAVNSHFPAHLATPFDFDALTTSGPAIVGTPAEVVDRMGRMHEALGTDANLVMMDLGGAPRGEYLEAVELLASDVIAPLAGL